MRVLCTSIKNRVLSWFDRFTLIKTVWTKMSQNSYLREFCAQVSQILFLADLTVLWLITTVWAKLSENSYLHEFCAQVSQIVFLPDLTIWRFDNCISENITKLISPRLLRTRFTNRVLSWFDRFTVFTTVWAKMSQTSYLREFCAQVSKIVFLADLTVLRLIITVWAKMS